jgi:hypothetical protein
MADLAKGEGFQVRATLTGVAATRDAVSVAMRAAADELNADAEGKGILFLSFSGHGSQLPTTGGVFESDHFDETWCLADGSLRDNTIHDLLMSFNPGIRILVIAENCYAGGGVELPIGLLGNLKRLRHESPVFTSGGTPLAAGTQANCFGAPSIHFSKIKASVLVLAACAENQQAQPGLFTRHLLAVWRGGFNGTYCEFLDRIAGLVTPEAIQPQVPTIYMLGPHRPTFARQRPFSIVSDL